MAKKLIVGTPEQGFDITSKGQWVLEEGTQLTSTDDVVLDEFAGTKNNYITIFGSIAAEDDQIAIRLRGFSSWVKLEESAEITGRIQNLGPQTTLVNFTALAADTRLLVLGGEQSNCYNSGSMIADGVVVDMRKSDGGEFGNEGGTVTATSGTAIVAGDSVSVYNAESGTITAATVAVWFNSETGGRSTFSNYATVSGGEYAFLGGYGNDRVINSGTMTGDVELGAGNDTFEPGMTQELDGTVYGGKGDDKLIIKSGVVNTSGEPYDAPTFDSSQFVELAGGGKHDTVKSMYDWTLGEGFEDLFLTWEYNIDATGNEKANTIVGNEGRNHISGLAGDDILTGGKARDTFHFADGSDTDRIMDFRQKDDFIDLSGLTEVENYQDLMDNHIRQSGRNLIISAGDDQLIIISQKLENMEEANFLFA